MMNRTQQRITAGLAIALLHESDMGPVSMRGTDRTLGLPSGTTRDALRSSPYWQERGGWAGSYRPLSGLLASGFDYEGSKEAGNIARSYKTGTLSVHDGKVVSQGGETDQWAEANRKWLRRRCFKAERMGVESIPELSSQAVFAREAVNTIGCLVMAAVVTGERVPACGAKVVDAVFVEFTGPSGSHKVMATSIERILAHWASFYSNNLPEVA